MRHFDSEDQPVAEDMAHLRDCLSIHTGTDVTDVAPPSGCSRDCLLKVVFHNKTWNLCAETPDDKTAWQVSLEQARSVSQPLSVTVPLSHGQMYPGHTYRSASYPDQRYFGGEPPTYVVQGLNGQTTIVYQEQRPVYRTGSLMLMPFFWW
ncbi:hypothetical protein NP493_360g00016 [Ridgeia piscesae]|uniref:Uncharacterized protein n=1 Tax=Ridgeia piscesae TaxID=27915 RepID=A0AAD9L458_RIDPI|nr:hypothetical protein NP493_360g00016 [Ridgeia piscesae]